jgi:membrane protease YdiL (CAAX protease family)
MNLKKFIQRYPASCYFVITFTISWLGAFIVVAPKIISREPVPKMDGILMFPIMILGPAAASIILTAITEGKEGLRNLFSRMTKWKVPGKWYLIAFLISPCLIMTVLLLLTGFVSPAFTPNFFPFGLLFGIPAGFFEEIGWTGFAFPQMRLSLSFTKSGIILGFLWGLWHLPVIDFLGAASPHGEYWLPFALSFIVAMAAIRIIIVWIYTNTNSVLLAQLLHMISTGSLVLLGPSKVTPGQEALWYAYYAIALWITVLIIFSLNNRKKQFV